MRSRNLFIVIFASIALLTCKSLNKVDKINDTLPYDQPPKWSREAIWYQIFVERFRNGNPTNNPTIETCKGALVDDMPNDWTITPWNYNWYKQEEWAKNTGLAFDRTLQMRRFGGDLQGVQDKIDYLVDLGITAVYFNPLNDAPSLHKYDARYYHHIDVTFGDDANGDIKLIATENPSDAKSWVWTNADKKFIETVRMFHKANIKVVLDFSWNHTGSTFWAFEDIKKNKENSNYKHWYHNVKFGQDDEGQNTFEYDGWFGIKTLPELRKVTETGKVQGLPYEGDIDADAKKHIFDVTKRWMDPHGDGSCRDGIDGMRLDVAEHVPVGFWRDFRKFVRSLNQEFYLIGENWWDQWPDKLMDPIPWVKGDVFDAVMHYQWFREAKAYFGESVDQLDIATFKHRMDSVILKYPDYTQQAMMNLASSHDSPRLLTAFLNVNKYKVNCKPQEDPNYRTDMPKGSTFDLVNLFLLHQFTFVGAPHIWNGDELGMTGADDPDNRKPMWWDDIDFDEETQSTYSKYQYIYKPKPNLELLKYMKQLIALRKENKILSLGNYKWVGIKGNDNLLAYTREYNSEKVLVILNATSDEFRGEVDDLNTKSKIIFKLGNPSIVGQNTVDIPARSGIVIAL
jgi:cyclomaltodextrinase